MNITTAPSRNSSPLSIILSLVLAVAFETVIAGEISQQTSADQNLNSITTISVPSALATVIETEGKYSVPGLNFLFNKLPPPWIAIPPGTEKRQIQQHCFPSSP